MTIESAKAFVERMKNDEDFRKELDEKSSPDDWMKFVKENGFDFSKDELEQVKSELSEDELEKIGAAIVIGHGVIKIGGIITVDTLDTGEPSQCLALVFEKVCIETIRTAVTAVQYQEMCNCHNLVPSTLPEYLHAGRGIQN